MAEYANINRVYRIVKHFFNKDQHGNLKVDEFNSFADYAQKSIASKRLNDYRTALRLRFSKSQHATGNFASYEDILQDIRTLHISYYTMTSSGSNNVFQYPSDYQYYTQFSINGIPCEVISQDDAEYSYIMNSSLANPSSAFPLVILKRDSIVAMPSTLTSLEMSYYKTPQGVDASDTPVTTPPTWAYNVVGGVENYNAANSINFELPVSLENELAMTILEYFGVNMREAQIAQYSAGKSQQLQQQQTT